MWNNAIALATRRRLRCPSDLTAAEWALSNL
jgi:hypothetical protein